MNKLTSKEKTKITKDWVSVLPSYSFYKPLHLVRRHECLLLGIYLKPVYGGEHYEPTFYIHSLLNKSLVVTLSTKQELINKKGIADSISLKRHISSFEIIIEAFKEQCPLAFQNTINGESIHEFYSSKILSSQEYPIHSMIEHILFLRYFKKDDLACEEILKYLSLYNSWKKEVQLDALARFDFLNLMNQPLTASDSSLRLSSAIYHLKLSKMTNFDLIY